MQIRSELAEKELILLQKEQELLEKDQTLMVLKEEVRPFTHVVIQCHTRALHNGMAQGC